MRNYSASIPDFALYEKCKRRLELLGYYRKVETCHNFFEGDQWGESPPDNMPRPVVNIVEPIVTYKVGQVSQNGMNLYVDSENKNAKEAFASKIDSIWESQDMENVMYDVLMQSAISGLSAVYCYFDGDKKDVQAETKDAREIIFACEEETDMEKQDFIMLPYYESVSRLKNEAEKLGLLQEQIELICEDAEESDDITKRCVCVLKLWKEDGEVHFCKFTKNLMLVEDKNTKLSTYPIAILPWGENSQQIRGKGEVSKVIQNQVEINKNYARRAVSIMDGAYPRIAYLSDMVENPEAISEVGSAIGVSGTNVMDVAKAITYLSPSRISSDAESYTSELIELTRSLTGASDNSIGLVNPEAASGTAILAVQAAQNLPLQRQVAKMRKFVEKLGRIWLEILGCYMPYGFVSESGKRISKKDIEKALCHLKVDIVSKNPFTTTAVETALSKYLESGHITFAQYVAMLPHGGVHKSALGEFDVEEEAKRQSEAIASAVASQMKKNTQSGNTQNSGAENQATQNKNQAKSGGVANSKSAKEIVESIAKSGQETNSRVVASMQKSKATEKK